MDMLAMRKKVIFVPTPGQTEQEHLATVLHNRRVAPRIDQHNFNLKSAILTAEGFSGFDHRLPINYLATEIERLVQSK